MVEPAPTVNIAPCSQKHLHGLYDSAVFSPHAESDWLSHSLNGELVSLYLIPVSLYLQ